MEAREATDTPEFPSSWLAGITPLRATLVRVTERIHALTTSLAVHELLSYKISFFLLNEPKASSQIFYPVLRKHPSKCSYLIYRNNYSSHYRIKFIKKRKKKTKILRVVSHEWIHLIKPFEFIFSIQNTFFYFIFLRNKSIRKNEIEWNKEKGVEDWKLDRYVMGS